MSLPCRLQRAGGAVAVDRSDRASHQGTVSSNWSGCGIRRRRLAIEGQPVCGGRGALAGVRATTRRTSRLWNDRGAAYWHDARYAREYVLREELDWSPFAVDRTC